MADLMLKSRRLVELNHKIYPGKEEYKINIKTFPTEKLVPRIKRRKDVWYILQEVTMNSHIGTHIEFPYHHWKKGNDAIKFPIKKLIGDAVCLDFSFKENNETITVSDIKRYKIQREDIVLIRTDRDKFFRTRKAHERPYLTLEATKWLIEKKINCIGTDATGLEIKETNDQPIHTLLFKNNIPLIESMTNLNKLRKDRFEIFILPLAIKGLDSCPVRIIALER